MRPDPEYFRVAFYGRGFPAFLQNKIFVYRGKGFERLSDFTARLQDQFPKAELMTTTSPPSDEDKERPTQWLQVTKVDPLMATNEAINGRIRNVHQQILNYYKTNEVNRFTYSRPFIKDKNKKNVNEFANLWIERTTMETKYSFPGVLQWFQVQSEAVSYLSPIQNAVETVRKSNESLRSLILEHQNNASPPPLNPLSLKLNGIIDAAVNGGIGNYERAFFNEEFAEANPESADDVKALKNLIAEEVPLLEAGIRIHDYKKTEDLTHLHTKMEQMFAILREEIEAKYGKRPSDIIVKRSRTLDKKLISSESMMTATQSDFIAQNSLDTTIPSTTSHRSRMLSAIGIVSRKKSNVSLSQHHPQINGFIEEGAFSRSSLPRTSSALNSSTSDLDNCSINNDNSNVVVTQHARQISRTAKIDEDDLRPVLPPKNRISDPDDVNNEGFVVVEDNNVVVKQLKKKAPPPPPPPPPPTTSTATPSTPPTPPKKPPFKPPIE